MVASLHVHLAITQCYQEPCNHLPCFSIKLTFGLFARFGKSTALSLTIVVCGKKKSVLRANLKNNAYSERALLVMRLLLPLSLSKVERPGR